jgi:glycosyltransferase involved in cell wall biosynthesis
VLRVLADASCLRDRRRDAGIGRYATLLLDALRDVPDLAVTPVVPRRPPRSESRPGRWMHAQPLLAWRALRERPSLLHGLGGEPALGWPSGRQVVTVHDLELRGAAAGWAGPRGRALRAYTAAVERLLRRCGALIAVSEVVATEVCDALGVERSRVHVVPHGVTPGFDATPRDGDAALRASAGVTGDDVAAPYVVWVGSLRSHDPRKALDALLEAAAGLGPRAVRLVLVGAPGAETRRVAAVARRHQLHVVLPGHVADATLAALLRGAAAAVVPSLHEGFGLPALEAMACGAPLVASRAGNLPALVGDAALLVAPGDAGTLQAGLAAVLGDAVLAATLREAGPHRAAGFTWRRTAEATAAVYRSLAAR